MAKKLLLTFLCLLFCLSLSIGFSACNEQPTNSSVSNEQNSQEESISSSQQISSSENIISELESEHISSLSSTSITMSSYSSNLSSENLSNSSNNSRLTSSSLDLSASSNSLSSSSTHVCTFTGDWQTNDTHHWKKCSCGQTGTQYTHLREYEKIVEFPTCTTIGIKSFLCICGKTITEHIPTIPHSFTSDWQKDSAYHWKKCSCGAQDTKISHSFENDICLTCNKTQYTLGLEYSLINNDSEYAVTGIGNATDTEIVIRNTYNDKKVTTINEVCFYENSTITNIILGDNITSIGNYAFYGCTSLTNLSIGRNVTDIGDYAFYGCTSLTNLSIGRSVTDIGDYAFYDCTTLTNINYNSSECLNLGEDIFANAGHNGEGIQLNIGSTVKTIVNGLFNCQNYNTSPKITNIVFEENSLCEKIERWAFCFAFALQEVHYNNDINKWAQIDFGGDESNPLSHTENFYINNQKISNEIVLDSATKIGSYAFCYCSFLTKVIIGEKTTSIGDASFFGCTSLSNVSLGNNLTYVGQSVFDSCNSLQYNEYKFTSFLGNEQNPYLFLSHVNLKALSNYEIHPDTKLINACAFYDCSNLTNITIPSNIKSIGDHAFSNCNNLAEIYYNATECNDLTADSDIFSFLIYGIQPVYRKLIIGSNVKKIPAYLFDYTSFGTYLRTIEFEKNSLCEKIGISAFGADTISNVYYNDDINKWVQIDFENITSNPLHQASGFYLNNTFMQALTINASTIKKYSILDIVSSITIGSNVEKIEAGAIYASEFHKVYFNDTSTWYKADNYSNWINKTGGTLVDVSNPSRYTSGYLYKI